MEPDGRGERRCGDIQGSPSRHGAGQGSFAISSGGLWKDFATDEGGDVVDLIMARENIDFVQVRPWLERQGHLPSRPTDKGRHGGKRAGAGRPKSDETLRNEEAEERGWLVTEKGGRMASAPKNVLLAIEEAGLADQMQRNEWAGRTERLTDGEWQHVQPKVLAAWITVQCNEKLAFNPTLSAVSTGLSVFLEDHRVNPVTAMLHSLGWDGRNRYAMLARKLGAKDTPLNRHIAALLVRGPVGRALEPGCSFPYILWLFSLKQGTGKSEGLQLLALDGHYTEGAELRGFDINRKLMELVRGMSIVELAEAEKLEMGQATELKRIATQGKLRATLKFHAEASDLPANLHLRGHN